MSIRVALSGIVALVPLALAGCGGGHGFTLDERTAQYSSDPEAAHELATHHVRNARQEDALRVLLPAIEEHPHAPALYARLGYVLRYAGLFEQSIEAYEQAIALYPSAEAMLSGEGQIAKGLVYAGRYDDALALQQGLRGHLDALDRSPDEKILFYEGIMRFYAGDGKGAVHLFNEAEAEDPESVWTEFGRAYRDAIRGDTTSLRARARALRERDVSDGERHYRLVHFHALAGEPDEAVERLKVALEGGFFAYPYIAEDPLLGSDVKGHPDFLVVLEQVRRRHNAFRALAPERIE